MLYYPIRLNTKLAHVGSLASMGLYRPTEQMFGVRDDITAQIDAQLALWYALRDTYVPALNSLIRASEIDIIGVPED